MQNSISGKGSSAARSLQQSFAANSRSAPTSDFVCFELRIVVEVDGGQHAEQVSFDEERTRWLETRGYRVLRFWNNDVLANTDAVAQTIFDAVRRKP